MASRLEIGLRPQLPDPAGAGLRARARAYLRLPVEEARVLRVLTFDTALDENQLDFVRQEVFTNPVTELSSFAPLAGQIMPAFDWALWVGLKPGVRDNEGATAIEGMADALGREFGPDEAVYASRLHLLRAPRLTRAGAEALCAELLANPIIQRWRVIGAAEWDSQNGVGLIIPRVELGRRPVVERIEARSDAELMELSDRRGLFLNPADLPAIRAYFDDPRVRAERAAVGLAGPTDVELEYISQARSDHCNHNTFTGRYAYRDLATGQSVEVDNLFKSCIKTPTEQLAAQKAWVVSVLWDNAGVARLDEQYNYAVTGETHNSPSNMEAYGGAITGIVGVYRDPLGTGLGSKLAAGMWGFCVGPRDYDGDLRPLLHPRRLLDGLIDGVRDGGNKSGIPTALGTLIFDERYLGKCLVFVGAVGVMPREVAGRPSHLKAAGDGDLVIMCGGRVGADGIHGVTASSAGFSDNTPAGHVQIGDPYTQKKMHDFLLEARDEGLINFITDNGGGGLSSSIGESARSSRGAEVDLAKAPLKYQGLDPWQIWVSESQERMTVAVAPDNLPRFMSLSAKHGVESTVLGRYAATGKLKLTYGSEVCCYVDVDFLESGFPQWRFEAQWTPPALRGLVEPVLAAPIEADKLILELLASPNLCSRQWINRQFDHEVQGSSVIKPFVGPAQDVPSEAAVLLPRLDGRAGLAMAQVFLTEYGDIDTYDMVAAEIDEGLRRVTAVGGDPAQTGGMDNFCWPSIQYDPKNNPDGRYKAAQLVRACWALRDCCLTAGIPLLSGKDSMYVDGTIADRRGLRRRVSGPPTMMFTATAPVHDLAWCQTLEPKVAGDIVYVLGRTKDELGGGALYNHLGQVGLQAPKSDLAATKALCLAVHQGLKEGLLAAVCLPSRGGLALAWARMALAGGLGLELDLDALDAPDDLGLLGRLFSESTGRLVVCVDPAKAAAFEALLADFSARAVGRVTKGKSLVITSGGQAVASLAIGKMRRQFTRRFGALV
ncbi:Phosphoribosylformylglycinamidine synthase [Desulfarculus baarsii DSM 2075]|uniref:Phosphoribosylformylglycinamidine synthase subunit PurL n=1 Tax=Desulfarculus baarsii (strain ATCC 33931 / DSM 2075 / LMG 7858 / VKM B-1802 / 2st14) TaxID=644282 RepID=E1QG94_DESB2|nr:AIR synthase-related protein [Desulfarculus baarsii]ADK83606.1 Phosphoribosylformylglycinamidine synthase [Desulfarculus baarsii DSM 2075]